MDRWRHADTVWCKSFRRSNVFHWSGHTKASCVWYVTAFGCIVCLVGCMFFDICLSAMSQYYVYFCANIWVGWASCSFGHLFGRVFWDSLFGVGSTVVQRMTSPAVGQVRNRWRTSGRSNGLWLCMLSGTVYLDNYETIDLGQKDRIGTWHGSHSH